MNENIMRNILLLISFILIFSELYSQNINNDLIKINQEFEKSENLSVNMLYSIYCNKNSKIAEESKLSKISKFNNCSIYEGFGVITFIGNDITLIINDENKTIRMMKSDKKLSISDVSVSITKIMEYVKNTVFEETQNERLYILTVNKLGIKKIIIRIHKNEYKLKSIEYFQDGAMQIEKKSAKSCINPVTKLIFSNYSKVIDSEKPRFSLSYYLTLNSGKYSVSKNYKEYKIINLLKNKKNN